MANNPDPCAFQREDVAPDGGPWDVSQLTNKNGMTVEISSWGATWTSAVVPVDDSTTREVLLGASSSLMFTKQTAVMGGTVGRVANRLENASFTDPDTGKVIQCVANVGKHMLHGGPVGYDKRRWEINTRSHNHVELRLSSKSGDQGFPGAVQVIAIFRLAEEENALSLELQAVSDATTPINMTCHPYFNLDGTQADGSATDVRDHRLQIFASKFLQTTPESIPLQLKPVEASSFDFRQGKPIKTDFLADEDQKMCRGYDHSFLLDDIGPVGGCDGAMRPCAKLTSADGKLSMDVLTDAPAVQLYTGNWLEGEPARKMGMKYAQHAGVALETQLLPNAPNRPDWPHRTCFLRPNEIFSSKTVWKFNSKC